MAIPNWVWSAQGPATAPGAPPREAAALEPDAVRRASDAFETLAHPVRAEILAALYRDPAPRSYTQLRDGLSVEDNGRLNYHLRRLDGLVRAEDGAYRLTDEGRSVTRHLLAEAPVHDGE